MNRSGRALGMTMMMMGVGLLPAACGPASEIDGEIHGPGLEAMIGKPGGQDTNGTPKQAWHTWKGQVVQALLLPLLQADDTLNPGIVGTGILGTPEGEEVFDHTVRCALAKDSVVTHGDSAYTGRGMVAGGSSWAQGGLPLSVIDNVLECVVAFVNDKTDGVEVLLTGLNVVDDEGDHTGFIHGEAVWCAHAGSTLSVNVDVYPTYAFARGCGIDAKAALEQRYCHKVGACGLNYMGYLEFNPACKPVGAPADGQYICNEKPCTMTWLNDPEPDWCNPPPRRRR
ncbi:hypothetical protein [Sorangium sp. So ce362]|uniref:hypothetical protein n=1 Tax=Sorangium sp. So ce362 TaxID=3133303 RepID=UPI003F60373A